MKITDIFKQQEKTFSFEFFPPKDEISAVDFGINVGHLMRLSPSFVSVTYGAGGSSQSRTFDLVDYLQNKIGLTTMAHYTCLNATKDKILDDLKTLNSLNIKNMMLLRGDPPKGEKTFKAIDNGFSYASELIDFAKSNIDICAAGACYVEKHPEAESLDMDIRHLKEKVTAGVDLLISQLFFDNSLYFDFVAKAKLAGVNKRIIPGVIPITNYRQIERFTNMSGAKIPESLIQSISAAKDNSAKMYQIGLDFTIQQCKELLAKGAPGIHFYTLNKSRAAVEIFESL